MKIVSRLIAALTLAALSSSVLAQSVSVGTVVGQKGNTVVLAPSFTTGPQQIDLVQFAVSYPNVGLSNFSDVTVPLSCGGTLGSNNQCVVNPNADKDAFQVIVSSPNAFPNGTLANITFTINGAATAGDVALTVVPGSVVIGFSGSPADPAIPVSDGTITITDGPQPVFGSAPTAATGVSISGEISTTIQADVIINNQTGEDGSTLNYTCTESSDPSNKFTISGDITNVDVAKGNDATITVACDSSAVGGPFGGEMSCEHNGSNTSPAVFPLSCTVNAGPEPAYTGAPVGLAMVADEEGDPDPSGSLTITNTGDATTTLSGSCGLSGDAEISLTGGAFSVAQGAAGAVLPVACDASTQGDYSATLSCTHNGTNVASPVDYAVTCSVGPPGPAVYASTPAPGSVIEMTPSKVPAGGTVADQVLTISNAAPEANDSDLTLFNCGWTGSAEITATAPSSPLAPMASTQVTFSCDSTNVGDYTGTYSCEYSGTQVPAGNAPLGGPTASYTVNCGVREAGSDISTNPAPLSTLNITVPMNGTGATFINVSEVNDEGVDATIDSCSLEDGSNFTILTAFPLTVPAGNTVQIQIEGTDPGNGSLNFTDTMTCSGTDSDGTEDAVWFLNMNIQTAAIPTLSTLGLLALILTMFGFGSIMIRRKIGS